MAGKACLTRRLGRPEGCDPLDLLAEWGTFVEGGEGRVVEAWEREGSVPALAEALKAEMQYSGYGSPVRKPRYIHEIGCDSKGARVGWYDELCRAREGRFSYRQLAEVVAGKIARGEYPPKRRQQ